MTQTTYSGSCHCGQIKFEVDGELPSATACNCSICQCKGALMWFVPRAQLRLLTPPEAMRSYTFNKHVIQHHFCPTCGIHPFGECVDPKGNAMDASADTAWQARRVDATTGRQVASGALLYL